MTATPDYAIGECRIWALEDGILWDDGGAIFGRVPRSVWSSLIKPTGDNKIALAVRGFLVQSGSQLIVIDAGFGRKDQRDPGLQRHDGDLLDAMTAKGFVPGDVTHVVNTHLHTDHAGGNTTFLRRRLVATFPRASYLVQRREWAAAHDPHPLHADLYHPDDFEPLAIAGRVHLLDGAASITPEVTCRPTPGHTPGHQVVLISSGAERLAIIGDLATLRWQLTDPLWVCPYDLMPAASVDSKRSVRDWLDAGSALVGFAHDDVMAWPCDVPGRAPAAHRMVAS